MATGELFEIRQAFSLEQFMGSDSYHHTGEGDLPTWFDVTSLAAESLGAAASCLARYVSRDGTDSPSVEVDRRLASFWSVYSVRPVDWKPEPAWDPISGDYAASDGWIRLHANHHREQALSVLGCAANRDEVAKAVASWKTEALETAIVDAGGCAAAMRSLEEWQAHPQGAAVAREPLVHWDNWAPVEPDNSPVTSGQPFSGLRVLDLTRVIAGPAAGRLLSAYGADVLRIDPPFWEEPGIATEMTLGKRCAGLDLKDAADREILKSLLRDADILLHGYRPGALNGLGLDPQGLRAINPRLVDVSLCAYGWSGPWSGRRGFDTLVQMSSGITDYSMKRSEADVPPFLPVAILDYATGFLMAAAAIDALDKRRREGRVMSARLSLARTAHLLLQTKRAGVDKDNPFAPETPDDLDPWRENTDWGPCHRLRFPIKVEGQHPAWRYAASKLRSSPANWAQFS